ncbi:Lysis DeFective 2 [Histoplasma ohiense]|nr:Lysis DeFective 2 [Histoplasma ohiense (nom. inval.)]
MMIAFNNRSHPFLRRIRLRFAITSSHFLLKFIYVRREHYSPQSDLMSLRIQKPMQVQFSGSASTPEGHISQCLPDQDLPMTLDGDFGNVKLSTVKLRKDFIRVPSYLHCLRLQWVLHRLTALSGAADIFSPGFDEHIDNSGMFFEPDVPD